MKNFIATAKTVIVLGAIAAASVGCKQATAPAPVDTVVTTPVTATTEQDTARKAHSTMAPAHATNAGTAMGSSKMGASGSGTGDANMKERPAVRSNTGETQGTTPGTSLPVSDGSR